MVAAICGPRDKRINSAVRIAYVRSLRTIYYSTMNAALHFRSFDTKIIWLFRRHRLEEFFCARRVSSTNQIPKYSRGISSVFNASSWQKYRAVLADRECTGKGKVSGKWGRWCFQKIESFRDTLSVPKYNRIGVTSSNGSIFAHRYLEIEREIENCERFD